MIFVLKNVNAYEYIADNTASYEIVSEVGAACSGLRLYFNTDNEIGEIKSVKAVEDGKTVFFGFCDLQNEAKSASGFKYFIYARSSASLLVDNEARPFEYKKPSAKQLFICNAKEFGFECALPEIFIENDYAVTKGTSCFGAVNNFVRAVTGAPVYVDENNVMRMFSESSQVKRLNDYAVVSQSLVINRGDVISRIDYKISSEQDYKYHCKNAFAEENGIERSEIINLSGLPPWQRETAVRNRLIDSFGNYYSLRVQLAGSSDFKLYDRIETDKGEFLVFEIIKSKNKNEEKTTLVLKRKIEGELINYVA